MDLSPKQDAIVLDAVDSDAAVILSNGAVSSGKTFSTNIAWSAYTAIAPAGALAIIGKTHETVERNVIDPLMDVMPHGSVTHTRGANTAVIFGRLCHVLGANDKRAEDRIRGLTLAGAYVDEATLLPKGYWDMLMTRLRVPGAKLFATTNPDHPRHPLKLDVIDKAAALGYRVHSFTMDDNPGLDPVYVARMKASFAGLFYRRFILGEWVAASGAIYDMLNLGTDTEPGPHRATWEQVQLDPDGFYVGGDYGTANATHIVLLCTGTHLPTGRRCLFVVGEWCYSGRTEKRALTDAEQSRAIRSWLERGGENPGVGHTGTPVQSWNPQQRRLVRVHQASAERFAVDPAAASFKTQLRRDGMSGVRDANNSVLDGLRTTGSLIAMDRLVFVAGAAPMLEGQMLGYVWDDDPAVDAPASDQEDHGCDGLRYAVMSARPVWRGWLSDTTPEPEPAPARRAVLRRSAA